MLSVECLPDRLHERGVARVIEDHRYPSHALQGEPVSTEQMQRGEQDDGSGEDGSQTVASLTRYFSRCKYILLLMQNSCDLYFQCMVILIPLPVPPRRRLTSGIHVPRVFASSSARHCNLRPSLPRNRSKPISEARPSGGFRRAVACGPGAEENHVCGSGSERRAERKPERTGSHTWSGRKGLTLVTIDGIYRKNIKTLQCP